MLGVNRGPWPFVCKYTDIYTQIYNTSLHFANESYLQQT
jgi:hypothetical protein